ncbi:hypothetical protein K8B83_08245 [Shewanella inventionis]|uniref:Uncharacterized protein n=1 Tax=Shewanella inventionis TaxID=1738770 RepID=A0ABQ1J0J5_9GAMM|nr:hypothetical protein [Shewanella inventionis]MCL1157306.1 hypothetical protein [Shewanella inventionis]UAL44789.1 hypothetical protein K8B83_08245 [Shewanella inventionis]GGB55791.1 hypothetical protein GCM10011607_15500 [Shewanella inventionis]
MRYGSISLALLCLYASNSFAALEVITSSEQQTLNQIETEYDIDSLLINVNDKFSQLNKKAYDVEGLKKTIASEQLRYDALIEGLPQAIRSKTALPDTYKQIEESVILVDELTLKAEEDSKRLETEKVEILSEYEKINKQRASKSQQLFKLKTDITNRLIADLSKSSSTLPVNINGSTECSKYQTIAACLKESQSSIVSNTRNESPFLNDKSVLLSYEVIDANMNMRGDLNYKVAMKFKPSYNNKIDEMLNEKLGLKSAMVTLVSNVPADWFVNGVKIGTGKKLFHEIPLGKHGILASYQNQDQSSVENIEGNGVFNYKFSNVSAPKKPVTKQPIVVAEVPKGILKPSAKQAQQPEVQKPKAKYTLFSDQTSIKLSDDDAKKTSNDKGYEYFMGVSPATKKQNIEFTNEPIEK